jgi:hypothetical protein
MNITGLVRAAVHFALEGGAGEVRVRGADEGAIEGAIEVLVAEPGGGRDVALVGRRALGAAARRGERERGGEEEELRPARHGPRTATSRPAASTWM